MPGLTNHHPNPQAYPQAYTQAYPQVPGALRTINFSVDRTKDDVSLGFNVRGGAEFGLGIFISCVTEGSIADTAGFMLGDQILSINGRSFEGITHLEAVEFITSYSSLSVTVMATGKIPEEEQPIGKYCWIANTGERIIEDCADCQSNENSNPPTPTNDSEKLDVYLDNEPHIPLDQTESIPQTVANNNQSYSSHSPNYIVDNTSDVNSTTDKESMKSKSSKIKSEGSQKGKNGNKNGSKKSRGSKKSIKNKDQARETMRYERDNLVKQAYESMKDSFSVEECDIIKQAVTLYHNGESVENLLNRVLPLFTPLRFTLLRHIRKVVYADEVLKFDGLVTSYLGRKKRESLVGRRAQSVKSPSAWSEDKYRQASLKSELSSPVVPHGVPLPGMQGGQGGTEIVLHPVKSAYISKDTTKKVEPKPTTFHFQPPETRAIVTEPEQKVKQGKTVSETTNKAHDETDFRVEMKAEPAPTSFAPLAEAMYSVPQKVKKVVTKVEKTEIVRQPVRKPSFEIKKKISGDSAVLSVQKIPGDERKKNVLIFRDSSFDESNNTITINATLNIDSAKFKKGDSIKSNSVVEEDSTTHPVVIEDSTTYPVVVEDSHPVAVEYSATHAVVVEDLIVNEGMEVVVNEPVTVEDVTLTMESPPMKLHDTFHSYEVSQQQSSGNNVFAVAKSKHVYEIDKNHQFIGLSISGGSDSRYQREIRVVSVNPNSASHLAGMQVGQELLSIDEHSLLELSHADACQLIRSTFRDKTNNIMKIVTEE